LQKFFSWGIISLLYWVIQITASRGEKPSYL
jgi:hypothetical protein